MCILRIEMPNTNDINEYKGFYNIPEEVLKDISNFRGEIEKFIAGEIDPDRFKPYRVSRGVYSQRGQKSYMIRIKVPGGGLMPHQMVKIAELADKYGNSEPHVTDRQDFQIHWVQLKDTPTILEELATVSLTTKGGGGNTIRNITASPFAGVSPDEAFDTSPYPVAMTEHFLTNPKSFKLPRKFKFAFSGSSEDSAYATMQDVGFIAKIKNINDNPVEGFRVYVGGGMGAKSRVGDLLHDFVPVDEVIYISEAIVNLFDAHGNRRNKHQARLRFLIEKIGLDEFKKLYEIELGKVKAAGEMKLNLRPLPMPRNIKDPSKTNTDVAIDTPGFNDWFESNVAPQKQIGYYSAKIKLHIGDVTSEQLTRLASIIENVGEGTIRNMQGQNILVRYLVKEELPQLYNGLVDIGLAENGAGGVEDILCCPGASSCNLGVCLSKNMSTVISQNLKASDLPLDEIDVDIKISGCPNSCGQHPIGGIGLFGVSRGTGDGRKAPFYNVMVGGRVEEGKTRLAESIGFIPSKKMPKVIEKMLGKYLEERNDGEDYHSYLDRIGFDSFKTLIKENGKVSTYAEDPSMFTDWGAPEEFSLSGLGPGECSAGVFDMIDTDLKDAAAYLDEVRAAIKGGNIDEDTSDALRRALITAARALLISQGLEPETDVLALREFEKNFVEAGYIDEKYKGLEMRAELYASGGLNEKGLSGGVDLVSGLIEDVTALYNSLDDSLTFKGAPKKESKETPAENAPAGSEASDAGTDQFMDLRGVKCPINYVKAKIKLEGMETGKTLLLYLDDGEPIQNVPTSLKNDGQNILKQEQVSDDTYFELIVRKQT